MSFFSRDCGSKDIASLDASQLSIMPTGFEALPPDDLKALLEYLAQPHP